MASAKRRLVRKDTFDYYDLIIYAARNSQGARELARGLKCRRWFENPPDRYKRRRAYFRGRPFPVIVNWGSTIRPDWGTVRQVVLQSSDAGAFLNPASAVSRAINKLETLKCLTEAKVPTLKWTVEPEEVRKWLKKDHAVFARRNLTASGGAGITVVQGRDTDVIGAPMYTRNYPKTHEFRVHVFNGQVIDFVEKKAKLDANGNAAAVRDRLVRNHDNGWVFAHDNLSPDLEGRRAIERVAVDSVRALGLLFGGVDILAILNEGPHPRTLKSAVVCEVNTAPGLECTATINAYKQAILGHYRHLRSV